MTKQTIAFLLGLVLMLVGGGWVQWHRLDPEFRRALILNLHEPEILEAIHYYNELGVPTGDITQKQLNDFIEQRRHVHG